eukprot:GHRQ01016161.1.p3 GENE.GHRQ01016161.1~~GHRQ01016161.1.p3  ORF type:complete len:105 (-),score=27.97 GHRQ01016161.1:434-748(-)
MATQRQKKLQEHTDGYPLKGYAGQLPRISCCAAKQHLLLQVQKADAPTLLSAPKISSPAAAAASLAVLLPAAASKPTTTLQLPHPNFTPHTTSSQWCLQHQLMS